MKSSIETTLTIFLCGILLTACGRQYSKLEGITFIAPLGNPPIDYVIWSPIDQDEILVTASVLGPGNSEIYVLNISTKKKQILAQSKLGQIGAEAWTPDGERIIAFVNSETVEFKERGYWIIPIDGDSPEFFDKSDAPIWSPDEDKIALYSIDQEPGSYAEEIKLRIRDISTNQDETIFSNVGVQRFYGFSWAPDGQNLVFAFGDDNSRDIYIINVKTQKLRQITANGRNSSPVWSPKGDIIVYNKVTVDGLKSTIHLIRPDGSCDIEIPNLDDVRSVTWSPDGMKLAFVASDGAYYLEIDKIFGNDSYQTPCQ